MKFIVLRIHLHEKRMNIVFCADNGLPFLVLNAVEQTGEMINFQQSITILLFGW
ncbi:hypothetical protein JCM10003_907 [Bacteroides pyogenes JCM 10003]|uniref:Uncharacterized protein n=2 Tax=Bacteroides pyogenes TaxID=310300 RepID=W4PHW8_9BACE|nr:hypothetical protein JCM6294_1696 [Bacteroides pyogenes DSM 20611 = JCM 6294]GAE21452.1 hypothetical protein JCM10003_907 [Bacteroides pyogenes JCM 10003]